MFLLRFSCFVTLTLLALEDDPLAVLQTMRQYIGMFFGCRECGKHFEEMAQESMSQVKSLDEAVLWLWRKHNQVNARLAGKLQTWNMDWWICNAKFLRIVILLFSNTKQLFSFYIGSMSEDPMFPKTQWPTPDLCPTCHEEQDGLHVWNEDMVLAFLKKHYSAANISPKYTSDIHPEAGAVAANKAISTPSSVIIKGLKPSPEGIPKHMKQTDESGTGGIQKEPNLPFLGLGFSGVDMSLCVLLYAFSCVFLMLMFFFFRVRSKRWKIKNHRLHV